MKKHALSFLLAMACINALAQSHFLTVNNGYGSGLYETGDTVHVWSAAFYGKSYFERWTGDTMTMNDPLDWHTRLIMPDHDITVEAIIGVLPIQALYLTTEIQAVDTLKKIWVGLPATHPAKGLIWLFHGTNGSGENFFLNNDMLLCVNKMMSLGYAVISLDCEEKTYLQDFNQDGVYRWDYNIDTLVNIDLRNVKAIRDTLIERGLIDADIPHLAYGYSAGGAFSSHIATILRWRVGIQHNSPGVPWVPGVGLTPMLYSMTQNDDHPEVGPEAAIEAQANTAILQERQICAAYRYALTQPLYPERFHRDSTISLELSAAIFNELEQNQVLNPDHTLLFKSEEILPQVLQQPLNWPVLLSLNIFQRTFVADEIDETYATHRFNADLFGSDIRFIESLCESTSAASTIPITPLVLFPNPASDYVVVPNHDKPYFLFNQDGRMIRSATTDHIDISGLSPGTYMISCGLQRGVFIKQ